eukprot:4355080-Heterocapsa_arctica.AAC.1
MADPCASASDLYLSVLGSSSASLFLPLSFMAATTGPRFRPADVGVGGPPAATSFLGPISCDPWPPHAVPCGVVGAGRPAGSPFIIAPFGSSGIIGLGPWPPMISVTAC